jgi:DNA mismatch repair ATPase MutS
MSPATANEKSAAFESLIKTGTLVELRAARDERNAEKKKIEEQLSGDKTDMLEERGAFIKKGLDPRSAQLQATANTDHDWRHRAATALRHLDTELPRLKRRIHELEGFAPWQKPQPQFVEVLRGHDADQVAARLRALSVQNVFEYDGAVIIVHGGSREQG